MAQYIPAPRPGERADRLNKDPQKYLAEARERHRREILEERKRARRRSR